MKRIKSNFIILFLFGVFFSCKDNAVDSNNETLIYQYDGVIENIGGDCSGVQVRTRSIGTFDFTGADKIKFDFKGMSDADLSSISIYYLSGEDQINLVNLTNRDEINNTSIVQVDSPRLNTEIFSKVTLKSSVCTGQIFYISFSDLKIYKVN